MTRRLRRPDAPETIVTTEINSIMKYIAAYDTERRPQEGQKVPACVEACRRIVEVHQKHQMPATFFIVGKTLEAAPDEFRRLLDDPLFEIASHTWSHRMLRDNPFCGPAVEPEGIREEIFRGKEAVDKHFPDRECIGLRPGCSFVDGLRGAKQVLQWVSEAGYEYVSSTAWGPDFTLPAPFNPIHSYADEGFPELQEYPCHGWHDNVLKAGSKPGLSTRTWRVLAYPPLFPGAIPPGPIAGPEDEFRYNSKFFIDLGLVEQREYVNLIWHPWSLGGFDPEMEMLDRTFTYVREKGLETTTFGAMHRAATRG